MKRIGALLLGSFVFLCALLVAGCTDTTELQRQIDELKASQAEIQALKDEINTLKSQIDTNNSEFQDKLNQATARLAALEVKINGELIQYLNVGDTATFVSNGIKLFDIKVVKGTYRNSDHWIHFDFSSDYTSNAYEQPFNITAYCYNLDTKSFIPWTQQGKSESIDNIYTFADFQIRFSDSTLPNTQYQVLIFSNYSFVAGYQIDFINPY